MTRVASTRPAGAPGVVGLLLASGFGRRFDAAGRRNKLLARLPDGRPLVAAAAATLCGVLDEVAVVVPAGGGLVEAALSDLPVQLIHNPRAKDGIGASIAVGIAALRRDRPQSRGWLIALGDMPFILPSTIAAVAAAVATIVAGGGTRSRSRPTAAGAATRSAFPARSTTSSWRWTATRAPGRCCSVTRCSSSNAATPACCATSTRSRTCRAPPTGRATIDRRRERPFISTIPKIMKRSSKSASAGQAARRPDNAPVRYRIAPADPEGHLFEVVCDIATPDAEGQVFSLPAWIPGSYMIREFARNITSIAAESDGRAVALAKLDKHTWRSGPCSGALRLTYRVYAWDPSVRAAHLDETHAFFNGTSVFVRVAGHELSPHDVELVAPAGRAYRDWRVATTLPERDAARHGFGTYRADDYDALIDHPVEMGRFRLETFDADGVPHEIAYTGPVPNLDATRVNADLATLCAAQIRFFADRDADAPAAPFDRYLFLTSVTGDGYGGLEHRASTALLSSRDALPVAPVDGDAPRERGSAYLTFLGLVSHEYFHSWNVKRMKPAVFAPYDLTRENYTSLLWIFEGFTSYYDDLFLVRTGLATRDQYLGMVAKTLDDVLAGPGRRTQSVAESSFDAWVKYYRQDENTPNAVVSYYKKGALVALCLDLLIRRRSRGKTSLDDAMRLMWRRFGRDFYAGGGSGLPEDGFPALVREATGVAVDDEVQRWAYGTDELPIEALLEPFGIALRFQPVGSTPGLGARVAPAGEPRLSAVASGGAAHAAGLSAGDLLVAIDDLRVLPGRVDTLLARYRPGDAVRVTAFRGDLLQTRTVTLEAAASKAVIEVRAKEPKEATRLRDRWLAGDDASR